MLTISGTVSKHSPSWPQARSQDSRRAVPRIGLSRKSPETSFFRHCALSFSGLRIRGISELDAAIPARALNMPSIMRSSCDNVGVILSSPAITPWHFATLSVDAERYSEGTWGLMRSEALVFPIWLVASNLQSRSLLVALRLETRRRWDWKRAITSSTSKRILRTCLSFCSD